MWGFLFKVSLQVGDLGFKMIYNSFSNSCAFSRLRHRTMRILCPNGVVLHSDAAMSVAMDFVPVLTNSLDTIDDKQIRVSTNADYIVEADKWDSWIYSLTLLTRFLPRLAKIVNVNESMEPEAFLNKIDNDFGDLLDKLGSSKIDQLPSVILDLHRTIDAKENESLADLINDQAKIESEVFTKSREDLEMQGLYKPEYDEQFTTPKISYLTVLLTDTAGKVLNLYLPDSDEEKESIFDVIRNSENQLPSYFDETVADFEADSATVINWFNDIFSFYRLKLKIEAYREIKSVEQHQEQFVQQAEAMDDILREVSASPENLEGSDKNYFMLNKLSGFLNAFNYEQTILHAVTDISDFNELPEDEGYYVDFV